MTARSRHTENSAFVRDGAPTSRGIITKGQRWGVRRNRRGETGGGEERCGGLKKASLVGVPSAPRWLYRANEGGRARGSGVREKRRNKRRGKTDARG